MSPEVESAVIYFGCWDRSDHGFHDQRGRSMHPNRDECGPWGYKIDRGKEHPSSQAQGTRFLLHKDGWTALDVTDRTVDDRGGSHSAFLAPATLTEQQMLVLAWGAFPRIAERIGLAKPHCTCPDVGGSEVGGYLVDLCHERGVHDPDVIWPLVNAAREDALALCEQIVAEAFPHDPSQTSTGVDAPPDASLLASSAQSASSGVGSSSSPAVTPTDSLPDAKGHPKP